MKIACMHIMYFGCICQLDLCLSLSHCYFSPCESLNLIKIAYRSIGVWAPYQWLYY